MGLVLTRKTGQTILLTRDGEAVARVTITEVNDGKVKLHFEAPKDITIMREEILNRSPSE